VFYGRRSDTPRTTPLHHKPARQPRIAAAGGLLVGNTLRDGVFLTGVATVEPDEVADD
jgi:hypothetical protein